MSKLLFKGNACNVERFCQRLVEQPAYNADYHHSTEILCYFYNITSSTHSTLTASHCALAGLKGHLLALDVSSVDTNQIYFAGDLFTSATGIIQLQRDC